MFRAAIAFAGVCFAAMPTETIQAEIKPNVIRQGKRATALVVVPRRGFATAFCIDKAGFFVTNYHVVRSVKAGQKVKLVLHPGEADEKVVEAVVVRTDKKADLALLRIAGAKGLTPLSLGTVAGLSETQRLIAFGYPFGTLTALTQQKYPNVSVNLGRVTSLRKLKGKLIRIQLDAQLNTGNSGGPVLNEQGQVVGIVNSGFRRSGVNFAIPISHLAGFLARPVITFKPPSISGEKQGAPPRFSIRASSFGNKPPGYSLELVLTAGGKTRRFPAKSDGTGLYTVTAVPVPGANAGRGARPIPLTILFENGKVTGTVTDQPIGNGPKSSWRFSQLLQADVGKTATLITRDGRRVTVPRTDLKSVRADLGETAISLDLSKCTRIVVNSAPEEKHVDVSYQIVARLKNRIVGELKGALPIRHRSVATAAVINRAVKAPTLAADKTVVRLPASLKRIVVGGDGRYLILHIPRLNNLAVFDVASAKVLHYVPCPTDDFLYTAGTDKLIIVRPKSKTLERWSLTSFEKEFTARVPGEGLVKIIEMGSNSRGPLLVLSTKESMLLDVDTFKELPSVSDLSAFERWDPVHGINYRASANGMVFTFWYRQSTLSKPFFRMVRFLGDSVEKHSVNVVGGVHSGVKYGQPSSDGSFAYTSQGYVYTDSLKPVDAPDLVGAYLMPAGNAYFTSLRWREFGTRKEKRIALSVHLASDRKEIVTLNNIEELNNLVQLAADPKKYRRRGEIAAMNNVLDKQFTLEKRIHLIPSAGVLITIPTVNNQIVIRKLNLDDALKNSGRKYLFIDSTPVRTARPGKLYDYQISVKSKSGGVRYKLSSGPKGMHIENDGRVVWQVPADFAERKVTVIISISDADGMESFHTFDIGFQ